MIRIFLGNVGSGKTISAVREMLLNENNKHGIYTYSNIITKKRGKYAIKKNNLITREMIIKKELKKIKSTGEEVFSVNFNKEYWMSIKKKGFNVVLDEAHTLMDARKFNSKQNKCLNDFLALIRKIVSTPTTESTLTLISQLSNRIDVNARQMATEVRYHICFYEKMCKRCGGYWTEHSELIDYKKNKRCMNCGGYQLKKINQRLRVYIFPSIKEYERWYYNNDADPKIELRIKNIEKYFKYYDTAQIDNLISEEE